MNPAQRLAVTAVVLDDGFVFTLEQLSQACGAEPSQVHALVSEGILNPEGMGPQSWTFTALSLSTARAALRLSRDLELSYAGAALVIDLLDRIELLKARLRRAGR
jgi:chaperone modulatory protein CbpM